MNPEGERHYVVVDGSNLATEGRTEPSLEQLDEAVRSYATEDPAAEIIVVVDASFAHRIRAEERPELEQAVLHGEVVSPPAGAVGRGDAFVLRIAERTGARVLSNDSFQEFHEEHPWLFDPGRLIGGKPVPGVGWIFTPRSPVRGPRSAKGGRTRRVVRAGDGPPPKIGDTLTPSAAALEPSEAPTNPTKQPAKKRAAKKQAAKAPEPAAVLEPSEAPTNPTKQPAKKRAAKKQAAKAPEPAAVLEPSEAPTNPTKQPAKKRAAKKQAAKAPEPAAVLEPSEAPTKQPAKKRAAKKQAATTGPEVGSPLASSGAISRAATTTTRAAKKRSAQTPRGRSSAGLPPTASLSDGDVASAIEAATAEALHPEEAGDQRAGAGRRRRRRAPAPVAVNQPLPFITFVAEHPLGSVVEGEVAEFTSHGAMVDVVMSDGGTLRCYVPLAGLGDPPPRRARQVLSRGERRGFVLTGLDPPRRAAELALPDRVRDTATPSDERAASLKSRRATSA